MAEEVQPNLLVMALAWFSFVPGLVTYAVPITIFGGTTAWLVAVISSTNRPFEMAFPAILIFSFATMASLGSAAVTTVIGVAMAIGPLLHKPARRVAAASLAFNLSPWLLGVIAYIVFCVLVVFASAALA